MSVSLYPRRWGGYSERPHCWYCDDPVSVIRNCANCMTAIYCDKQCQRDDWHRKDGHKLKCKKIVERKKIDEELSKKPSLSSDDQLLIDKLFSETISRRTPEQNKESIKRIMREWESLNPFTEDDLLYPLGIPRP